MMFRNSFLQNAKRFGAFAVFAVVFTLALSGCKKPAEENSEQGDQQPGAEQAAAEFPKFSTELKFLGAAELQALGEKNSIPTEFVFPNASYVQVVYPDRITAVENGDAAVDYLANNTFQIPAKGILENSEFAIFSRGFTFETLKDAKTNAALQEGFPSPVEIVYLKSKSALDQKSIKDEVFKNADLSKLKEEKIGQYDVTIFPNALAVPLDQTGQSIGKIEDVSAGLCFPAEDSVVFMSGTTEAFKSFLSDKAGDERGIAAQRLARIPMDNVAAAFQYDIDFSTPNANLVQLPIPVTQELMATIQKEIVAFQFMFDAATQDGNLLTLNVNVKSEAGAEEMRKAIGTALMKTVDSISSAQKNNSSPETNSTIEGLVAILKSVQLTADGTKVVATVKNSPENAQFIANSIKDLNDVRINTETRQKYQVTEQTLLQIGALFTRYSRENKSFPAPICAEDGTPLLSWRVALLPTLGEQFKALYDQFKLDEPWNSDNNIKLLDKMPAIFASASDIPSNKTQFLVFNSPETPFGKAPQGLKLQDVEDPYSTFSVVYASPANAIEWTKPETFVFNPSKPSDSFGDYVCGITLMGELISAPCDDSEKSAKSLAALVFGAPQDNSGEAAPATEETAPAEEAPAAEEVAPSEEAPAEEEVAPSEEAPVAEEVAPAEEAPATEEAAPAE